MLTARRHVRAAGDPGRAARPATSCVTGSSILIVALWHLAYNLGSATKAGEGAGGIALTAFVIVWGLFIARAWRRRGSR